MPLKWKNTLITNKKEYAKTSQILAFTIDDLKELGITLIEDREQIYEAIQDTKSQV